MRDRGESHASVHRQVVAENLRDEMNRKIAKIYDARFVATWDGKVYSYGTERECRSFIDGLGKRADVRPITDRDQAELVKGTRQAYKGL